MPRTTVVRLGGARTNPAAALAVCAREGTLTSDEVYSLTAFLLFINEVFPEDQVLDQQSLPKVNMPIGDAYAKLPDWKPRTKRLPGYPY